MEEIQKAHDTGIRGHWTPEEDEVIRKFVSQSGPQKWNIIAESLPGRSGKSCRLRWHNQLDPKIRKGAFTEEDNARLLAAHLLFGNKWSSIVKLFPGRTDNSIKNQYHVLMARKRREGIGSDAKRSKTINESSKSSCEKETSLVHNASSGESSNIITRSKNNNRAESFGLSLGLPLPEKGQEETIQHIGKGSTKLPNENTEMPIGTKRCTSFDTNLEAYQSTCFKDESSDEESGLEEDLNREPYYDFMGVKSISLRLSLKEGCEI